MMPDETQTLADPVRPTKIDEVADQTIAAAPKALEVGDTVTVDGRDVEVLGVRRFAAGGTSVLTSGGWADLPGAK